MTYYTPEIIERAKNTMFYCGELNKTLTIGHWWVELMSLLNYEEESFSGKRPLGNGNWKGAPEKALILSGILQGHVDEDGYIQDCEESMALFEAIIRSLK